MKTPYIHISLVRMIDLLEGQLSEEDQEVVKAHIDSCKRCTDELLDLQQLLNLMHTDDSADTPPILRDYVLHLYSRYRPPVTQTRTVSIASLIFNSARPAFAYGVRSARQQSRQMFFKAEGCDIDLRIEPTGSLWQISGQILGKDGSTGTAQLSGEKIDMNVSLNDQYEFVFQPVDTGEYQLILHLAQEDIRVDKLVVGEEQHGSDRTG